MKENQETHNFGKGGDDIPGRLVLMPFFKDPQRADSVIRSLTASLLAFILISSMIYIAIFSGGTVGHETSAAVRSAALIVVGFYFGGHVAQNTSQTAERRQIAANEAGQAHADRAEASARRAEKMIDSNSGLVDVSVREVAIKGADIDDDTKKKKRK